MALPILIDENTKKTHKIASFPVFCLIGLYLGTNLLHFPFFYFNLELALPILIDENTKKTHKIASFPVFCLIGHKITSYLLD